MQIQYYIRFRGNKNDVDLNTLVSVCSAFSSLLNAAAEQLLLSDDFVRSNYANEEKDWHLITLSMQQTEKGSCIVPILADIAGFLDADQFKAAIDCFLSETSRIFNDDFWRAALGSAAGNAILDAIKAIPQTLSRKKDADKKDMASRSTHSCSAIDNRDIAEIKAKELRVNENVYQATLNLYRALHSDSLNTSFSIENDDRETILETSRDQQDVLESPLMRTADFYNQIMKIEFVQWINSGNKTSSNYSIKGKVLGASKTLKLNDSSFFELHNMHLSRGEIFDAIVSGKMMTNKDSGTVYYRDLIVEKIID